MGREEGRDGGRDRGGGRTIIHVVTPPLCMYLTPMMHASYITKSCILQKCNIDW